MQPYPLATHGPVYLYVFLQVLPPHVAHSFTLYKMHLILILVSMPIPNKENGFMNAKSVSLLGAA